MQLRQQKKLIRLVSHIIGKDYPVAIVTKVRKTRLRGKNSQIASVAVFSYDTETKKRHGYYTLYSKTIGKETFGVTFTCYYNQGKIEGQCIRYSMFYPQYVQPGYFFNLDTVTNYVNGSRHGLEIVYDAKNNKPLICYFYKKGIRTDAHIFSNKVHCFEWIDFRIRYNNKWLRKIVKFDNKSNINYVQNVSYRNKNEQFIKETVNEIIDGKIVCVTDLKYHKLGSVVTDGFEASTVDVGNEEVQYRTIYKTHNSVLSDLLTKYNPDISLLYRDLYVYDRHGKCIERRQEAIHVETDLNFIFGYNLIRGQYVFSPISQAGISSKSITLQHKPVSYNAKFKEMPPKKQLALSILLLTRCC